MVFVGRVAMLSCVTLCRSEFGRSTADGSGGLLGGGCVF